MFFTLKNTVFINEPVLSRIFLFFLEKKNKNLELSSFKILEEKNQTFPLLSLLFSMTTYPHPQPFRLQNFTWTFWKLNRIPLAGGGWKER